MSGVYARLHVPDTITQMERMQANCFHCEQILNPTLENLREYIEDASIAKDVEFYVQGDAPLMPWQESLSEFRTTMNWGQLKLLVREIHLLTMYPNAEIVVYAGAADGEHIPMLADMFPNLIFDLYDPRTYSQTLRNYVDALPDMEEKKGKRTKKEKKRIRLMKGLFTPKTAELYTRTNNVILISDIRSVNPGSERPTDENIHDDMTVQMKWVQLMKPIAYGLKFRLTWEKGTIQYLDGNIFIQAYKLTRSTEGFLIGEYETVREHNAKATASVQRRTRKTKKGKVGKTSKASKTSKGSDMHTVSYDNTRIEQFFMYHNTVTRASLHNYSASLSAEDILELARVPGLDNCYDCALFVNVIAKYKIDVDALPTTSVTAYILQCVAASSMIKKETLLTRWQGASKPMRVSTVTIKSFQAGLEYFGLKKRARKTGKAGKVAMRIVDDMRDFTSMQDSTPTELAKREDLWEKNPHLRQDARIYLSNQGEWIHTTPTMLIMDEDDYDEIASTPRAFAFSRTMLDYITVGSHASRSLIVSKLEILALLTGKLPLDALSMNERLVADIDSVQKRLQNKTVKVYYISRNTKQHQQIMKELVNQYFDNISISFDMPTASELDVSGAQPYDLDVSGVQPYDLDVSGVQPYESEHRILMYDSKDVWQHKTDVHDYILDEIEEMEELRRQLKPIVSIHRMVMPDADSYMEMRDGYMFYPPWQDQEYINADFISFDLEQAQFASIENVQDTTRADVQDKKLPHIDVTLWSSNIQIQQMINYEKEARTRYYEHDYAREGIDHCNDCARTVQLALALNPSNPDAVLNVIIPASRFV